MAVSYEVRTNPYLDQTVFPTERLEFYRQALKEATGRTGPEEEYANDLINYGLNSRFGVEMEFLSSCNKYVLANRVNSCMYAQNAPFWRDNYDVLHWTGQPGPRPITADPNNFNEWSSFMLEASEHYHAPTFRGTPVPENKGIAGHHIEKDSSVILDVNDRKIYVWSVKAQQSYNKTDLASSLPVVHLYGVNLGIIYGQSVEPLKNKIHEQYELVTNVLANEKIIYPYVKYANRYQTRNAPLGFLSLDNLIHHMLSHESVLLVQRSGFHLHLSEYPRLPVSQRNELFIGFIKLFYLFEPMLYACQPTYRADNPYCRSIQSLFTFDEVSMLDKELWDYLMALTPFIFRGEETPDRGLKESKERFVSLNIGNCDGANNIGTIEIRLGHSTFDTEYINRYITVLQNLLKLSEGLIAAAKREGVAPYAHINDLLQRADKSGCIPYYCHQGTETYSYDIAVNEVNISKDEPRGTPHMGFFMDYVEDNLASPIEKSNIVYKLFQLFYVCTGATNVLSSMINYTNLYHAPTHQPYSSNALLTIHPHNESMDIMCERLYFHSTKLPTWNCYAWTAFQVNKGVTDLDDECAACYKTNNVCIEFNQGVLPEVRFTASHRNTLSFYQEGFKGKVQTELLNHKLHPQQGGRRRSIRKTKSKRRNKRKTIKKGGRTVLNLHPHLSVKMNPTKNQSIPLLTPRQRLLEEHERLYRITAGLDYVHVHKENGVYHAYRGDWMGGRTPYLKLDRVFPLLLRIIDETTLMRLVEGLYIEPIVYLTRTPLHQRKLREELASVGITSETVDTLCAAYESIFPSPYTKAPKAPSRVLQ